jgi:hypothetical protein
MKPVVALFIMVISATIRAATPPSGLERLDFLTGKWKGTSAGQSGDGVVERECARVLNARFIECSTTVTYAKEVHVERAIYSFDKQTKTLRMRQFHGEGFVNTYTAGDGLVFVTDAIENIPAGWRARESYEVLGPDSVRETFELAAPAKDFTRYSAGTLQRVK